MVISNKYNIGDVVYLKTDVEQLPRIVTGIGIRGSSVTYELANGTGSGWHSSIEISKDKDVMITSTN